MLIIGHRGAGGLAPENTLASLQKALEHHADRLEFDLRVTRDDIVVLNHEPHVSDGDGNRPIIATTNYDELKKHKADLTTLEEVLKTFGAKIPFYIEVKAHERIKPIVSILKTYLENHKTADLWLGSKSQTTLLELHTALPNIPTIVIEPWIGVRAGRRARQLGTKQVAMNQRWLWWGFVRSVKHSGWELYAYPLNDVS